MNSSRTALVALLVAVELLIVGLIIKSIGGGPHIGQVGSFHSVDYEAKPIEPLAAGDSPHVIIDDEQSFVSIVPSQDGRVHVVDHKAMHGLSTSTGTRSLEVSRTADGVRIVRTGTPGFIIGSSDTGIDVAVPPGATIEILRCAGASVTGMAGAVVHSNDGRITLTRVTGNVDAESDDGSIVLEDVQTSSLIARSSDGRVTGHGLSFTGPHPTATIHSGDGSIKLAGSFPAGTYDITTSDGSIEVALAPGADLTLHASTGDGSISVDGKRVENDDDSVQQTIQLGAGAGTMHVASEDGSVHLITNGAI